MADIPGLDRLDEQYELPSSPLFDPRKYLKDKIDPAQSMDPTALAMLMSQKSKRRSAAAGKLGPAFRRVGGGDVEVLYGKNVAGHEGHLHLAAENGLKKLGRVLERKGFDVGEHPAFGGVDPVHTNGSHHYDGNAFDVNYNGGGRWDSEPEALRWLKRKLRRRFGDDAYYG